MSKSCGSRPSKKSRTQPPTQKAAKPVLLQLGNNFSGRFARRRIHEIYSHAKARRRKEFHSSPQNRFFSDVRRRV
jgi:hypothetical protein